MLETVPMSQSRLTQGYYYYYRYCTIRCKKKGVLMTGQLCSICIFFSECVIGKRIAMMFLAKSKTLFISLEMTDCVIIRWRSKSVLFLSLQVSAKQSNIYIFTLKSVERMLLVFGFFQEIKHSSVGRTRRQACTPPEEPKPQKQPPPCSYILYY